MTGFPQFGASYHSCPSSTVNQSELHAQNVRVPHAALNSEGEKVKDLSGNPCRIYAVPSGI